MEQLLLQSTKLCSVKSNDSICYGQQTRHWCASIEKLCIVTELLVVGFWPVLYIPNKQIINT